MAPHPLTRSPVLWEDESLLVVLKPSGVLSHPNPRAGRGGSGPRAAFEGEYDLEKRIFRTPSGWLWLMHRLDQEASGVLIAAKDERTAGQCRRYFETGQIRKMYVALTAGRPHPSAGQWSDPLGVQKNPGKVRSRVLRAGPSNARLRYRLKENFPGRRLSLLEIELLTGKTHQIRVQCAHHGCPVAGDEVYGNFPLNRKLRREIGLRRLFLHAYEVGMRHPASGKPLTILAPLPEDLQACLDAMSRFSSRPKPSGNFFPSPGG